jgi:MOSC domain-containing protein YiiM
MLRCKGVVVKVASDTQHRFSKRVREQITLVEGHGVEGDAHAGQYARHRFFARRWPRLRNLRQVHLIPVELFAELHQEGHVIGPGDLGENVATAGLNLECLPLGTKLHLGESAVVELTGLRTPCGLIDRFQRGLKRKMVRSQTDLPKFRCGVLGIVVVGGKIRPGDAIRADTPSQPCSPLPAL